MHDIQILGTLTLRSAAHQTSPDDSRGNANAQIKTSVVTKDGRLENGLPYITANSVRGQMRRHAGKRVLNAMLDKGQHVGRDTLLCVLRGAPSRTGIGQAMTLDQLALARQHVFAGVFGGGAQMLPSDFRFTKDLLPLLPATEHLMPPALRSECNLTYSFTDADGKHGEKGARVTLPVQPYMLTKQRILTGRDDLAAGRGLQYLANPAEVFLAHVAEVTASNIEKNLRKTEIADTIAAGEKVTTEAKKSKDLRGFNTFEMIVPGVKLAFDTRSYRVNDAQIGMMLLALLDFCRENRIGGQVARGCGSFLPDLSLKVDGTMVANSVLAGEWPHYELAPECAPYVQAAEKVLALVTAAELDAIYPVVAGEPKAKERRRRPRRPRPPMPDERQYLPLRISWRLATPWVPPAFGLHFDGLLAWAAVQEALATKATEATEADFAAVLASLPLAKHETPDGTCWKASLVRPVKILGSERRYMTAKTPVAFIGEYEGRVKASLRERDLPDKMRGGAIVDTVRGFYKAAAFYVPLQHAAVLEAYCIGDPARISELLDRVKSIGAKGRIGFGTVAEVTDAEGGIAPDFSVDEDQAALKRWRYRVLPEARRGLHPGAGAAYPPYWDGVGAQLAYRPASFA